MIENCFSQLFKIMLEMGHIPEKGYGDIRFPTDEASGVAYDRNYGIDREWMQRAKLLAHWFQQHLRLAIQKKIEDKTEKRNKINRRQ